MPACWGRLTRRLPRFARSARLGPITLAWDMQVLGITLVTNQAGRADNNHAEVLAAADAAAEATQRVVLGVLHQLGGVTAGV